MRGRGRRKGVLITIVMVFEIGRASCRERV